MINYYGTIPKMLAVDLDVCNKYLLFWMPILAGKFRVDFRYCTQELIPNKAKAWGSLLSAFLPILGKSGGT